MTNDDENTARELINGAFSELANNANKVTNLYDFAKMLARNLRDDTDIMPQLSTTNDALLLSVVIHNHGTAPHDPTANYASLEIEILAKIRYENSPLLASLTNPKRHYAYAIVFTSERPDTDQTALMLILATNDNKQLFALAIVGDDQIGAWNANDDNKGDLPDSLAATVRALGAAAVAQ